MGHEAGPEAQRASRLTRKSGTDRARREGQKDTQVDHPVDRRSLLRHTEGVSPLERRLLSQGAALEEGRAHSVQQEVEALRKLLDVGRELSSILDLDSLLDAVLDSAVDLTSASRGLLLLREGERLNVARGRGASRESLDADTIRISETLARQCMEEDRVVPYDNISQLPELRDVRSIKALELYAALCVPLRERGQVTGVLYLDSNAPGLRTASREIAMLEAFASHAAVALANARMHRHLEDARILLTRENEGLRAEVRELAGFANMLGASPAMRDLFDKIRLVKDTEIPVLLLGESGTGKELVARALHYEGVRKSGPFVPVNCAGLAEGVLDSLMFGHRKGAFTGAVTDSPGLVEQADGGTLFLDEVGDMPVTLQTKLLRFVESGEFRRVGETAERTAAIRLIGATNRDIAAMVSTGEFREDLYFRLSDVRLILPPLRDREEDLPLLIEHFFEEARGLVHRRIEGISVRARRFLLRYHWPGNVRQLRRVIQGACALVPDGGVLDEEHLQMHFPKSETLELPRLAGRSLQEVMAEFEKGFLERGLRETDWNITRTARALGISRQHLHNRIRMYGLRRPPSGG